MNSTEAYEAKLQKLEEIEAARFSWCVDRVRRLGATIRAVNHQGIVKYFTNVYDAAFYFNVDDKIISGILDKGLLHPKLGAFMFETLKPNKDGSPYMPDTPAYRYSKPVVPRGN